MAYCPKCEKSYPIVTSTKDSSRRVPTTTERYNSEGDYIGYEEGETYAVNTETLPRCSNCYSVFEFPNAISKEEFFYAKRDNLLEIWRRRKPVAPSVAADFLVPLIIGGGIGVLTAAITANTTIGILVGVGVAVGTFCFGPDVQRDAFKKYADKIASWNKELDKLRSLTYSDENYERLVRPQLSKEASEKHKEVWRRIKLAKVKKK
jgi:hypothetical protein